MCGIFGVLGYENKHGLETYAKKLSHRGPDGFGDYFDQKHGLYLAHCRLSIIDLSERGAQPMCNEEGTIWLTFNGEIYNFPELKRELLRLGHTFKSDSDTEVIIHAYEEYGIDCLSRLNGMFAFGIWDQGRGKLFLARDRVGIKPLYYTHQDGHFAFASEPKAIIGLPFFKKDIHFPALFCYLIYRYVAGEDSIWKGIKRLLPAHYLVYDISKETISVEQYWHLESKMNAWNEDDALNVLDGLMTSSVKNCLVSDVPVGVFLSGGVDSSCIASISASESPHINTFCIGFEGWDKNEVEIARASAAIFQTSHHEDIISISNFDSLKTLFDFYDEPLADTSIFPIFLVSKYARKYGKVALSGDGGDEVFAGYDWYTQMEHCRPLKKLAFMLDPVFQAAGAGSTNLGRRCNILEHFRIMTFPGFQLNELMDLFPDVEKDLFPEDETYLFKKYFKSKNGSFKRWQYIDFFTFLVENNLTMVDRSSMGNSLEVRVPFLDHRLVEFAFSLPDDLCVRGKIRKYILRRFLERKRGSHVANLPKRGFSCPVNYFWSAEDMRKEFMEGKLIKSGILSGQAARSIINSSADTSNLKIWLLAVLEQWYARWLA